MSNAEILIVEDELFIALGLQKKLEAFGYFVSAVVHTGKMAIEKALELQPDLILMDIVLGGGMDGIEAAKKIWDQFRIPVIYLSAFGDDKNLKRAKQTEPVGYLLKPYNDRELQITIELSLYKSALQKKMRAQQNWYSSILKSLKEAIITIGLNHSILFINQAGEILFQAAESVIGQPLDQSITFIVKGDKFRFRETIEQVIETKKTQRLQGMIGASGNKHRILDLCISPIINEDKRVTGAVLIFMDRTEQCEIQSRLELKNADLQKTQRLVLDLLTKREQQLLQSIVEGMSTKEIASDLKISVRTVEFHRYNLMRKLQVNDIPSLVRHAIVKQLVTVKHE
jgi:PAS domain S-box-containing protein